MNYGYEISGKQNQFRLISKSIDGKSLTDRFLARGKPFFPETVERLCRQFFFPISSKKRIVLLPEGTHGALTTFSPPQRDDSSKGAIHRIIGYHGKKKVVVCQN